MSKKFKKRPNPDFPFRRNPSDEGSYVGEEDKRESSDFILVKKGEKNYLKANNTGELFEVGEVDFLDEKGNKIEEFEEEK